MRFALTLVAALTATACHHNHSKLEDWQSGGGTTTAAAPHASEDSTEQGKGIDAPPKRDPVTATKLSPVIHEFGSEGVLPSAIVVQLATPVIDRAEVGSSAGKTRI